MSLITCYECGKQISERASTCPNCGAPVENPILAPGRKHRARLWIVLLTVLAAFVGVGIAGYFGGETPRMGRASQAAKAVEAGAPQTYNSIPSAADIAAMKTADYRDCDATEAYTDAQSYIRERLKAPATAHFPWTPDAAVKLDAAAALVAIAPVEQRASAALSAMEAKGVAASPIAIPCVWVISSHVDAANSFGAELRMNWMVKIQEFPSRRQYRVLDYSTDEDDQL